MSYPDYALDLGSSMQGDRGKPTDCFAWPERIMKTIKLNIKNASAGQMLTLRGELRIMAHSWKRFGPVIDVQAGKLKETDRTTYKRSITKW